MASANKNKNKNNTPIVAFGNTLPLETAYNWDIAQIYRWLDKAAEDPGKFGADDDKKELYMKKKKLTAIKEQIIQLGIETNAKDDRGKPWSNSGKLWMEPSNRELSQHIFRKKTEDLKREPPPPPEYPYGDIQPSYFQLSCYSHETRKFPKKRFWSPYDLLGLFLSSVCPAPVSSKNQFYIPLTAMYGQWCAKIAPTRVGGPSLPAVFQCTWQKVNKGKDEFFLGASYGGVVNPPRRENRADSWPRLVKYARYELCSVPVPFDFDYSPMRGEAALRNDVLGQRFGNCGETYPLAMILRDASNKDMVEGLALDGSYQSMNAGKAYNYTNITSNLMDPCQNCETLILNYKGNPHNFAKAGPVEKKRKPPNHQ